MVNFFDTLYYKANQEQILLFKRLKIYSLFRFLIRISSNLIITFYYNLTYNFYKKGTSSELVDGKELIVSLTSFPARIDKLWLVIESIFRQSRKPTKIILWLSKEQFLSEDKLPKKLLRQKEKGLEIRFVDDDIKSHKKYYYAIKNFPNDLLLTIDDDMIYRTNFIDSLLKQYILNSNNVVAHYCKEVISENNKLLPYLKWPHIEKKIINSDNLFFGTGGGVIFSIKKLSELVIEKDVFLSLTPTADDIWLNSIVKFSHINITCTGEKIGFLPLINKINDSLHYVNNVQNQNDIQIQNIISYFENQYNTLIFRK